MVHSGSICGSGEVLDCSSLVRVCMGFVLADHMCFFLQETEWNRDLEFNHKSPPNGSLAYRLEAFFPGTLIAQLALFLKLVRHLG